MPEGDMFVEEIIQCGVDNHSRQIGGVFLHAPGQQQTEETPLHKPAKSRACDKPKGLSQAAACLRAEYPSPVPAETVDHTSYVTGCIRYIFIHSPCAQEREGEKSDEGIRNSHTAIFEYSDDFSLFVHRVGEVEKCGSLRGLLHFSFRKNTDFFSKCRVTLWAKSSFGLLQRFRGRLT